MLRFHGLHNLVLFSQTFKFYKVSLKITFKKSSDSYFNHIRNVLIYMYYDHIWSQRSLKFKGKSCMRTIVIFSARNSQANHASLFSCKYTL